MRSALSRGTSSAPRNMLVTRIELSTGGTRCVADASVLFAGEGHASSLTPSAFHVPTQPVLDESHFCSLPPPTIDLAGYRNPNSLLFPQVRQVREQSFMDFAFSVSVNVVGMHDDTD